MAVFDLTVEGDTWQLALSFRGNDIGIIPQVHYFSVELSAVTF
jgi:hypothetical protein